MKNNIRVIYCAQGPYKLAASYPVTIYDNLLLSMLFYELLQAAICGGSIPRGFLRKLDKKPRCIEDVVSLEMKQKLAGRPHVARLTVTIT